jgi:antirestriction protein ArdC
VQALHVTLQPIALTPVATSSCCGWHKRQDIASRATNIQQALELGGHVRKGERGTKVYFVKRLEVKEDTEGNSPTRLIPKMREYTVFNVDQCESLPDSVTTGKAMRVCNPDQRDELADEFLRSTGADIRSRRSVLCPKS